MTKCIQIKNKLKAPQTRNQKQLTSFVPVKIVQIHYPSLVMKEPILASNTGCLPKAEAEHSTAKEFPIVTLIGKQSLPVLKSPDTKRIVYHISRKTPRQKFHDEN